MAINAHSQSISAPAFESAPFALKPGVTINGVLCNEAVVRLLSRADLVAIAKEPEDRQESVRLLRSIVRLGECADVNLIALAVEALLTTDEVRIRAAIVDLELKAMSDADPPDPLAIRRRDDVFDVLSEPFTLRPGIRIGEEVITTAVVRLIRRGEYRVIDAEPDETKRDTLTLQFGIHQLGSKEPTPELIDLLTQPDVERIYKEMEKLRAQNAPEDKSADGDV